MHPLEPLVLTYGIVLTAELLGDKSLIGISTLATRLRPPALAAGVIAAFGAKMLAAVVLGQALTRLPGTVIGCLSATTFFIAALFLWLKKPDDTLAANAIPVSWTGGAASAFAAIFFTEWGDAGQISAAALVARSYSPLLVWLGGTAAMVTKGGLAMTLGVGLRRVVPHKTLRYATVALCLTMALLSAIRGFRSGIL